MVTRYLDFTISGSTGRDGTFMCSELECSNQARAGDSGLLVSQGAGCSSRGHSGELISIRGFIWARGHTGEDPGGTSYNAGKCWNRTYACM